MTKRPKVPPAIKRALYAEAGYKCANPGCCTRLQELHHIRQWSVYQTHDGSEMIAICPTCHSQVHYGGLKIDDATVRHWKQIQRIKGPIREQVYVEPSPACRVLLGSLIFANGPNASRGITAFELSPRNKLGFSVVDDAILSLNLSVADTKGREVVRVVEGHLAVAPVEPVRYESRVGKYSISAPATEDYIPEWARVGQALNAPEALVENGRLTLLELEVIDPGLVQVRGVWLEEDRALVVLRDSLSLCPSRDRGFFHVKGYGEMRNEPKDLAKLPVFIPDGPITFSMIGAAFKIPGF